MRILIVNKSDSEGGAARAAMRLHKALLKAGVDSKFLVWDKNSLEPEVHEIAKPLEKRFFKIMTRISYTKFVRLNGNFSSPSWYKTILSSRIRSFKPDIIHIHWLGSGLLSFAEFRSVETPIFWTLHDEWLHTAGCHYSMGCEKYVEGCFECPLLKKKFNFISIEKLFYKRKIDFFNSKSNNTVIALSSWIKSQAERSKIFRDTKIIGLPNPIDFLEFTNIQLESAREILQLPKLDPIVLFGAMNGDSDPRKGFIYLEKALCKLNDIKICVFGSGDKGKVSFGNGYYDFGLITDQQVLNNLYNAANVFVAPSLHENLANSIMEALVCGTPVVAFDIGGNADMIIHKVNGYLVKPYSTEDLAFGINWCLTNVKNDLKTKERIRKTMETYKDNNIASRYIEEYRLNLWK